MKRFIYITLLLLFFSSVSAEEKDMAILKAQYTAWKNYHGENHENPRRNENKYILQIGEGSSYYYDRCYSNYIKLHRELANHIKSSVVLKVVMLGSIAYKIKLLISILRLFFENLLTAPRSQVFNPLKI